MEVDFLGHRITQEGLKMDDHKVKAILDWEPPKSVLALRSFLGLASYYCKFIKNFAKIATPLTNILKKSFGTYEWDGACNETFETLKGILVKALVLKLSDFNKDFEMHSDAFDFAIGRVLVQDGRLMAFESKKLSEIEQRWPTHEKEMWVVIHCLKTWGHYIGSKDVVVWTQCHLEILYHSIEVVIETSEMARHNGFAQCGHLTQAREGKRGARCAKSKTPT
jgi:hypothetical protein